MELGLWKHVFGEMPPNTLIFKKHKCIYKQTGTGNNTFLKGTDENKARIKICIDLVQYSVQVIISHISKTLESQWCLLCDSASGSFMKLQSNSGCWCFVFEDLVWDWRSYIWLFAVTQSWYVRLQDLQSFITVSKVVCLILWQLLHTVVVH